MAPSLLLGVALVLSYFLLPRPWAELLYRLESARSGVRRVQTVLDGRELSYLEGGQGETVVLLHGFGADKYNWVRFMKALVPRYRVVALDLPGFGDSTALPEDTFDAPSQAERTRKILSGLGLHSYHLVGSSMGGHIAGLIAHRAPERVKSLALIDAHGAGFNGDTPFKRRLDAGDNPFLVREKREYDGLLDLVFFDRPWIPYPIQSESARQAIENRDVLEHRFAQLNGPTSRQLSEVLREIQTPSLILWGEDDALIGVGAVETFERLPQHRTVVIKDCGHLPMLERPEETAAHYFGFLQRKGPRLE